MLLIWELWAFMGVIVMKKEMTHLFFRFHSTLYYAKSFSQIRKKIQTFFSKSTSFKYFKRFKEALFEAFQQVRAFVENFATFRAKSLSQVSCIRKYKQLTGKGVS